MQIAGMIFQTRSRACAGSLPVH
ncbi:DUF6783 domain-containing protein [Blautia wexlerae]